LSTRSGRVDDGCESSGADAPLRTPKAPVPDGKAPRAQRVDDRMVQVRCG